MELRNSARRGKGAAGIPSRHEMGSPTGLRQPTEIRITASDLRKKSFEMHHESSFGEHVSKVQETYERHSHSVQDMIKAKTEYEGGKTEENDSSSMYDKSTLDVLAMIRAKRMKEAKESERVPTEGGSDTESTL
ncbi:MAG: hypothetical protein NTU61_00795 [Candidatus Altiarchaeota archaeon]|nr:hypothetical protein [Candidatus Altiarchaeota archaeon]